MFFCLLNLISLIKKKILLPDCHTGFNNFKKF